ncbi:hypothetical protein OA90_25515 [Labrenzia sp. OB1]|nr:hypothetical protein OA90_25515 [Labrenzia sp. OB1]
MAQLIDRKDKTGLRTFLLTKNYIAAMKLELQVTNTGELAPSFNFPTVGPFLSIGAGVNLSNSSKRSWFKYLAYSMRDLDNRLKANENPEYGECPKDAHFNLEGELGIRDFVLLDISSADSVSSKPLNQGEKGEFGGTIEFTLIRNINSTGPTWTFEDFVGPGGLGKIDRTSVNKLTITFVQGESTTEKGLPTAKDFRDAEQILRSELYQREN